jgi:hypothetical protein
LSSGQRIALASGGVRSFRLMAESGDDGLLDDLSQTKWDEDEWEW